jgi:hypothetical protein
MTDTFLAALYSIGSKLYLRETTKVGHPGVFRDSYSTTRHTIVDGTSPISRPSATAHQDSHWVAWREGSTIYAKAIWWGPTRTRTVYEGDLGAPTAPAIFSFNGKLVVVWGVGNKLYLSASEYGVVWSDPLGKTFPGSVINTPALAEHGGYLYVGIVLGPNLYTVRIKTDLTWGPNYSGPSPGGALVPEVSLASDGSHLFMSFNKGDKIKVTQSPNGYNNWSAPVVIDTMGNLCAPPALHYFNQHLYAVYPTGARYLMKRSPDGNDWATPRFEVEENASGALPAAALSAADYSVAPPSPSMFLMNNSGYPASSRLNIVLVSEGYLESEMGEFRDLATRVANAFKIVNPYSKQTDKYNIYRIELPSRQKGVDASPLIVDAVRQGVWSGGYYQAPVPGFEARYTDTAMGSQYQVKWDAPHPPGYEVAEDPDGVHTRITDQKAIFVFTDYAYDFAEARISGFDRSRDILYVIVNQFPDDGGTEKASFNPVVSTNDFAEGYGNIHEIGHFLVGLSDEDFEDCWGGVATDCGSAANKSVNTNLNDPAHKWAHFFVSEGRPGDSIVANPVSRPPTWSAFWDPSLVTANSIFNVGMWATNGGTDWAGTGGVITYGPAVRCMMNHTGGISHFCPVCTEEVVKELHSRVGVVFNDSHYHNTYSKVYVEYLHRELSQPDYPKAGLISVNGTSVPVGKFTTYPVGQDELCSVDVTSYLVGGTNQLTFHQQSGVSRIIDLLSIQVVNSNGAPLPLFPVTDLSGIATPQHFADYSWSTGLGDLVFEFEANLTSSICSTFAALIRSITRLIAPRERKPGKRIDSR